MGIGLLDFGINWTYRDPIGALLLSIFYRSLNRWLILFREESTYVKYVDSQVVFFLYQESVVLWFVVFFVIDRKRIPT
jgi:hypothetical protein